MTARIYRAALCAFLLTAAGAAETHLLKASDIDGRDGKMVYRETGVLGIKGDSNNGSVWDGNAWFDAFPGTTGKYRIKFNVVIEADGDPQYEVSAGGHTIKSGRYPLLNGKIECSTSSGNHTIDCGEHTITAGDKINVWCKSVYYDKVRDCYGSYHGAYGRWKSIEFTLIEAQNNDDDTPPSVPGNVRQTGSTNSSVELAWDASSDAESGVDEYNVYLDGAMKLSTSSTAATITGLDRDASYSVQVSAVNGKALESAKSDAVTMNTANETAPENTLFFRARDGFLLQGMTAIEHGGALTGEAVYGETGSTDGLTEDHSRVEYRISIPAAGEWHAWGRFFFESGSGNSFWISVDGGDAQRFGNGEHALGQWHWEGYMEEGGVSLGSLNEGDHTITITAREPDDQSLLDIVCLSPSSSYVPEDQDVAYTDIEREMVRVSSPARGGSYEAGETMSIQWIADERIHNVDISVTADNGKNWRTISDQSIYRSDNNWGNFAWSVDVTQPSEECFIRVAKYEFTQIWETGISEMFSIAGVATVNSRIPRSRDRTPSATAVGTRILIDAARNAVVTLTDASGAILHAGGADGGGVIIPCDLARGVYFIHIQSPGRSAMYPIFIRD